eukprot:14896645-Ditylum_brightwellii.AAC.1
MAIWLQTQQTAMQKGEKQQNMGRIAQNGDRDKKQSSLAAAQKDTKKKKAEKTEKAKNQRIIAMDTSRTEEDDKVSAHKSNQEKMIEQGANFIGTQTKQHLSIKIEFT